MFKYSCGIFVLLFLVSCTTSTDLNVADKEEIIAEVSEMFEAYHNDIRMDGLTAEFAYLDDSEDFFWVPPGYNSALSYDSVRSILLTNAKLFKAVMFAWDTLQIFPLTFDIASYSGIVSGSMTDTTGNVSKVLIIESGTVIRRSDGWKILSGQSAVMEPNSE